MLFTKFNYDVEMDSVFQFFIDKIKANLRPDYILLHPFLNIKTMDKLNVFEGRTLLFVKKYSKNPTYKRQREQNDNFL